MTRQTIIAVIGSLRPFFFFFFLIAETRLYHLHEMSKPVCCGKNNNNKASICRLLNLHRDR